MGVFICQGCGAEHSSWTGKCPQCGTTELIRLSESTDRLIDKVIKGKYKIVKKLGQGGMGAVYLAEQLGIGQKVALKFLKAEFSGDAEIARRFLNEAKSYAKVVHPNAVTLHDFGQDDDDNLFIAMEYLDGVDLKRFIAERKHLSTSDAIDVMLQVADVLADAHSKGIVHRDLKPENIMLREGMRGLHAKVLDFGIARLMGERTKLTVAGAIAGTPRYMSPEQVEGIEVDHRADIYALGIVLFECLTGVQPFDGNTITEIMRNQLAKPMPHLREISPELDVPGLDAVIQRATAKKRDDRFQDLKEFAAALSKVMPTMAGRTPMATGAVDPLNATFLRAATPAVQSPSLAGASTELGAGGGPASPSPAAPAQPTVAGARTEYSASHQRAKSHGTLIALGIVGLSIVGTSSYVALNRPKAEVAPPPVMQLPQGPKELPTPGSEVPGTTPTVVMSPDQASAYLAGQTATANLARGQAEFGDTQLDSAKNFLKLVPADAPQYAEAQSLLKKIDTLEGKLKQAKAFQAVGDERACALFAQVLSLNPKIQDAQAGLKKCKDSAVPTLSE